MDPQAAARWLEPREPVIALRVGGDADSRLPAMERVVGLRGGPKPRVYPFSVLREQPVINDTVGGQPVVVAGRRQRSLRLRLAGLSPGKRDLRPSKVNALIGVLRSVRVFFD